jgi:predicted ATPase/DNA-binding winged helix-turn-helix (wHTH) protein
LGDEILSFGTFQLVPKQRLLLNSGKRVHLGTRALDILITLAERGGEIVTKKELLNRVWPHYAIDEAALRVHVSALRKVLGRDESGNPCIANSQGRGYSLATPVRLSKADHHQSIPSVPRIGGPTRPPAAATRVIGRTEILDTLNVKLLRSQFVSIVGPGGIGKTTVALMLAEATIEQFKDGQLFIDFALLSDPLLIPSAVASAVGLTLNPENPIPGLIAFFSGKHILLILDNCEHVIDGAAALAEELSKTVPTLSILATSREPLRASRESVHRLAPLSFPPKSLNLGASDALAYSAVELLVERAMANADSFVLNDDDVPVVIELCQRLDGNPLAIELVAASIELFGLRGVASRLQEWFSTLILGRRTALPRHQTLSATLDWSYDILPETEKTVLRRLAVFQGRASFPMVLEVISDDAISPTSALQALYNLQAKSLLAPDVTDDTIEYRLLETTRSYALQKLNESGEYERFALRHAAFFCKHFQIADSDWELQPLAEWLRNYSRRLADARAALTWAFSPQGDVAIGLRLLVESAHLWFELPLVAEYRTRVELALQKLGDLPHPEPTVEMRLYLSLGQAIWVTQGPGPCMMEACQRGLRIATSLDAVTYQMQAHWGLWNRNNAPDLQDVAIACSEFASRSADPVIKLASERLLALTHHYAGNQEQAWYHHQHTLSYSDATFRRIRKFAYHVDQKLAAMTLGSRILWLRGYPDQALKTVLEGVDYALRLDHAVALAYFLGLAACPIAIWIGDFARASDFAKRLKVISTAYSLEYWNALGQVYDSAISGLNHLSSTSNVLSLPADASVRYSFQDLELFATLSEDLAAPEIVALSEMQESGWCLAEIVRVKGTTDPGHGAGSHAAAEALFRRSLDISSRQNAKAWHLRAAISLAHHLNAQNRLKESRTTLESSYRQFSEGFESIDLVKARNYLEELGVSVSS